MADTIYLDTARLGLISPTAQQLQIQFARQASDPHSLLYFREFISTGAQSSLSTLQQALCGFEGWQGVKGLQNAIRHFVNASKNSRVLLASRSATIMQLAAKTVAGECQRILTVDLLWPPYRRLLIDAVRNKNRSLHICPLRTAAIHNEAKQELLVEMICKAFVEHQCDGLLLPLLDHRGVTLPIDRIVQALAEQACYPKHVAVDASQALGHIPIDLHSLGCDLLIGGTHKWLGSHQPLGVGVSLRPLSINLHLKTASDPLLRLTQEDAGNGQSRYGETAVISPLLSAAGALTDCPREDVCWRLDQRRCNRRKLAALLNQAGWQTIRETEEHHGILLARAPWRGQLDYHAHLQATFRQQGVSATIYRNGLVRFSMPHQPFLESELAVIQSVCRLTPLSSQGVTPLIKTDKVPRHLEWNRSQKNVVVQPAVST